VVDLTHCRGVSDANFAYRQTVDRDRIGLVLVSECSPRPS
jgi:hypothetical protein